MKELDEKLHEFGADNVSGARELADGGASILFDLLRSRKKAASEKLLQDVTSVSGRLLDLQPSIGPLYNLCNGLLLLFEDRSVKHPVEAGKEWLALFRRRLSRNVEELRRHAIELLPSRGAVIAYSYSSTVLETLIAGKKLGKSLRVFCSEGRPNLEGRRFARELLEAGIAVRFGVDAALFSWIEEADLVLLGGDALSRRGLLNKIGTSALVRCAKARQGGAKGAQKAVQVYALADSEKLVPTPLAERIRVIAKDPAEVWEFPQASMEVSNRYFEMTPLEDLDGIVTESGIETPSALLTRADGMPVASRLMPPKRPALHRGSVREIAKELREGRVRERTV